jgi:hypothetical protein
MVIKSILSTRSSNNMVYSDLIYEWEDNFSRALAIPIVSHTTLYLKVLSAFFRLANIIKVSQFIQAIDRLWIKKNKTLVFTLYPHIFYNSNTSSYKIPFIIDFDYGVDLLTFYRVYRNCETVIISSRVAFEYLKESNCPLDIKHVPLSINSDLKVNRNEMKYRHYDVFVARQNPILMSFLTKYVEKHPEVNYVVRKWEDNKLYSCNAYYSNKEGRIGEFSDRNAYFNLLNRSKIAFYTTTGCDMENTRFMNHVTPSLMEYLIAGCKIMIRWVDTPDSDFFCLSQFFDNVDTYEKFESLMDMNLSDQENHFENCDKFLKRFGFSSQLEIFMSEMELS